MRPLLRGLAAFALLGAAPPYAAFAQQGTVQVFGAAHTVQGPATRIAGERFEPDVGVQWFQPGTRFGLLQMELRGTSRDGKPHLGKSFVAFRDARVGGITWTIQAGDTHFSPAIGEYRFANLATPALTFAGGALEARTARTTTSVLVGRATAWRNIFGADAQTLDQDLALARTQIRVDEQLEVSARASRIRTRDLAEFQFSIAASDQAGMGARLVLTPAVQLIGDAGIVSYRRRGSDTREVDASALAGASILLARGWFQFNASRFSPGELPVLSQPLNDRQTLFAAGEYDVFRRLRLFGSWESFVTNLYAEASDSSPWQNPPTEGTRVTGGIRLPFGARSSVAFRVEDGDRRSRYVGAALTRVSDTGVASAEWQTTLGRLTGFVRHARRESVQADEVAGTFTQNDSSAHLVYDASRMLQLFGSTVATHMTRAAGGASTYWQVSGGGQAQLSKRRLWFRAEGTLSWNVDELSARVVPHEGLMVGVNGEIAMNTMLGLNVHADRVAGISDEDDWVTRSSLRLTRSFSTGSPLHAPGTIASASRVGGTGTLAGLVFADWNANGQRDPGEGPLENIPIRLANLGHTTTSGTGEFAFTNVPIGMQQVGIDLQSLPVDFDAPAVPQVQIQLGRGDRKRLAFGLVPLGSISGRVVRDANGNGQADANEKPLDGAVVVLDNGARSEQVRGGRFRFEAVPAGEHTLQILVESLPEGAAIVGAASVRALLGRDALAAELDFVVDVQQRPEIRRVFPPGGTPEHPRPARASAEPPAASTASSARPRARAATQAATPPPLARESVPGLARPVDRLQQFAVQVAALNDPLRARRLAEELRAAGYAAYLVEPPADDPDAPFRVRVGGFTTQNDAQRAASALGRARREKLWVVREVTGR